MIEAAYTVSLRPKNQLTLPAAVVKQLHLRAGDRLIVEMDSEHPERVQLRAVRRSYAGIAEGLYGSTPEEEAAYIREERASWDQ